MGYRIQKPETMIVVQTHPLKLNAALATRCAKVRREAGACWTWIKDLAWEYFIVTGRWMSEGQIKKAVRQQFALDSQTVQALVEKFVANRETTRQLRRAGNTKARYPYKDKQFQTPTWKSQRIQVDGRRLILKMGRGEPIVLPHPMPDLVPRQVELTWQNGHYYLHLAVEVLKPKPISGDRVAAIDLGEIHAVALTDESEAVVISGRQIRAVKQYRNKRVSDIQKALARCTTGSRKWKKLMKAKRRVQAKTEAQLNNLNHQVSAKVVKQCVDRGITTVVIGNPDGVQRNTRKGATKERRARKVAQKLSQWEFGSQKQMISYKLKARNVTVKVVDEAYTSQHCPASGHRHKPKGRNYRCRCGFFMHRDVLGAWNIRTRHLHGGLVVGVSPRADHVVKYRHPYRWLTPGEGPGVVARTGALAVA